MTNSHRLETVRTHFRAWLADQASAAQEPRTSGDQQTETDSQAETIVSESLLIRDDFYCGRSFQATSHRAVWFIEQDELKIHGPDGTVAAVFRGEEICLTLDSVEMVAEATASNQTSDAAHPDVIKLDVLRSNIADDQPESGKDPNHAAASTADESTSPVDQQSDDDDLRRAA